MRRRITHPQADHFFKSLTGLADLTTGTLVARNKASSLCTLHPKHTCQSPQLQRVIEPYVSSSGAP